MRKISRKTAANLASLRVDNALSPVQTLPANARFVVWGPAAGKPSEKVGRVALVVGCCSYLSDTQGNRDRLTDEEAIEIALDYALELGALPEGVSPDYVL